MSPLYTGGNEGSERRASLINIWYQHRLSRPLPRPRQPRRSSFPLAKPARFHFWVESRPKVTFVEPHHMHCAQRSCEGICLCFTAYQVMTSMLHSQIFAASPTVSLCAVRFCKKSRGCVFRYQRPQPLVQRALCVHGAQMKIQPAGRPRTAQSVGCARKTLETSEWH